MKYICFVLASISILLLSACSEHIETLKQEDFPGEWPFNVSEGQVECINDGYAVVFHANGKIYPVNEAAEALDGISDINEILLDDPNYPGGKIKMSMSVIEFKGLKRCDLQQ